MPPQIKWNIYKRKIVKYLYTCDEAVLVFENSFHGVNLMSLIYKLWVLSDIDLIDHLAISWTIYRLRVGVGPVAEVAHYDLDYHSSPLIWSDVCQKSPVGQEGADSKS